MQVTEEIFLVMVTMHRVGTVTMEIAITGIDTVGGGITIVIMVGIVVGVIIGGGVGRNLTREQFRRQIIIIIMIIIFSWIPDSASHFRDDTLCQFSGLLRYARNDDLAFAPTIENSPCIIDSTKLSKTLLSCHKPVEIPL
jgi:hypothetical protein